MAKFNVEITETYQKVISVEALSRAKAVEIVQHLWHNGNIELDSDDYVGGSVHYASDEFSPLYDYSQFCSSVKYLFTPTIESSMRAAKERLEYANTLPEPQRTEEINTAKTYIIHAERWLKENKKEA